MTPDFLIVGAMKCGTTTLYDDLARHPAIHLPDLKEPEILHRASDAADAEWHYAQHFKSAPTGALTGEGSTSYTRQPEFADVALRAREWLGRDLRIVYITRNPIKRIVSHLRHDYMIGLLKTPDFEGHLTAETRYDAVSDYPSQIAPWVAAFGPDHVLHLTLEGLQADRVGTVRKAVDFLGADPEALPLSEDVSNAAETVRSDPPGLIHRLGNSDFYRYRIRPHLPEAAITTIKRSFTRARPMPEITLSEATLAGLRDRFDGQDAALQAVLLGER